MGHDGLGMGDQSVLGRGVVRALLGVVMFTVGLEVVSGGENGRPSRKSFLRQRGPVSAQVLREISQYLCEPNSYHLGPMMIVL